MDAPFMTMINDTSVEPDFVSNNLRVAIPYLSLLSLAALVGTVGNILVICSVFLNKVRIDNFAT